METLNKKSLVLLSLAALVAASCAFSVKNVYFQPVIANGATAIPGQFPFYAMVKIVFTNGRNGLCGGTLINDQWVLTAAHCINLDNQKEGEGFIIDYFEVHLGAWNVTNDVEENRVVLPTVQTFLHPEYDGNLTNDVALLKLDEPVEFSSTIKAASLTEHASIEPGTIVTAVGFGRLTTNDTTIAPTLQYADLKIISLAQCAHTFPMVSNREDVICTIGDDKKSTCNGDSGGPLVLFEDGVPKLVGSTSFGSDSGCQFGLPAGFSNTYHFLSWIEETIASNDD